MAPTPVTKLEQSVKEYHGKLDYWKAEEKKWMDDVAQWRTAHKDKDEYHLDHPQEKKYLEMREKLDKKLKTISDKYEESKKQLANALEANDNTEVTNMPTINTD